MRAVNASLSSIQAGLKPLFEVRFSDNTRHFLFRNGQQRRQIKEGHSRDERAFRRAQRKARAASIRSREAVILAHLSAEVARRIDEAILSPE